MSLFEDIEGFVSGQLSTIKSLIALIVLETKLAKLSILPLLISLGVILVILLTLWTTSMLLMGSFIFNITQSISQAIASIFALNLILLWVLLKYLAFNLKNMSFVKTRSFFKQQENDDDERIEKADHCSNQEA